MRGRFSNNRIEEGQEGKEEPNVHCSYYENGGYIIDIPPRSLLFSSYSWPAMKQWAIVVDTCTAWWLDVRPVGPTLECDNLQDCLQISSDKVALESSPGNSAITVGDATTIALYRYKIATITQIRW